MSGLKVSIATATERLKAATLRAKESGYSRSGALSKRLCSVAVGDHLTFRYILITALLAKASDDRVNILSLQASAPITGAYDARSVCHDVVVPLQMSLFGDALGSSNEPFLNKPARTAYISKQNAVRGGRDKEALDALCEELPLITSKQKAFQALTEMISLLLEKQKERDDRAKVAVSRTVGSSISPTQFLTKLLTEAHHGETAVIVTALCLWLQDGASKANWNIDVHPSNEAGSSSNQVGDIDVSQDAKPSPPIIAIEVKDKSVLGSDASHFGRKAKEAGCVDAVMVLGPSGKFTDESNASVSERLSETGFTFSVVKLEELIAATVLYPSSRRTLPALAERATAMTKEIRAKDVTVKYVLRIIEECSR